MKNSALSSRSCSNSLADLKEGVFLEEEEVEEWDRWIREEAEVLSYLIRNWSMTLQIKGMSSRL